MSIRTLFFMGLGLLLIYCMFTLGFPFLLALLFVILLEPVVQFFIKLFKIKRPLSSLIVSTLFTFFIFLSFILIILKAAKESIGLSSFLLKIIKQMTNNTDVYFNTTETIFKAIPPEFHAGLTEVLKGLLEILQGLIGNIATYSLDVATTIPGILIEALIFFIAFYIISFTLPDIKNSFLSYFDKSTHNRVEIVMSTLYKAVIGFIRAQVIISILIFIITSIGLYLIGMRYILATALVITLVDFLPIFGTGSIIIPMALYTFINGNSLTSIGLLSLYGFLIVLRRIAEPKIVGNSIGISALSALISMYIGFKLVGFIGLIMGPTIVIIYRALIKEEILKIKIKF